MAVYEYTILMYKTRRFVRVGFNINGFFLEDTDIDLLRKRGGTIVGNGVERRDN